MNESYSFDDIILLPQFSRVESRSQVSLEQRLLGSDVLSPIINSNMDTISSIEMSKVFNERKTISTLHRFQSIEDNVNQFKQVSNELVVCSLGIDLKELDRAEALSEAGCRLFLIDVAHAASIKTVKFYDALRRKFIHDFNTRIIVGNFATKRSIDDFLHHSSSTRKPDMIKVGIGGGSNCKPQVVTGHGLPLLSSIQDCVGTGIPVIADGGIRSSGDMAKALAFGASLCMVGSVLAGTDESPGEILDLKTKDIIHTNNGYRSFDPLFFGKIYRGSASSSSYITQGKNSPYRASEGEERIVPLKGPVIDVLDELEGGLRSALSYSNAFNLNEFRENAKMTKVSMAGNIEGTPHGLRK